MASCVPVRRGLIRPAGTWRALARTAALLVILVGHACRAAQRELIDVSDYVNIEDIEPAGACTSGCVRTVVEAVARVKGEIECDLRVQNLLDHTKDDVRGGALNVVHSCSDSEGNLAYQVRRRALDLNQWSRRFETLLLFTNMLPVVCCCTIIQVLRGRDFFGTITNESACEALFAAYSYVSLVLARADFGTQSLVYEILYADTFLRRSPCTCKHK